MGDSPAYAQTAQAVGTWIGQHQGQLIYGGGNNGLMGVVAQATAQAGGRVVGVIPQALVDKEVARRECDELHVVQTMHERKQMMAERADGVGDTNARRSIGPAPGPDAPDSGDAGDASAPAARRIQALWVLGEHGQKIGPLAERLLLGADPVNAAYVVDLVDGAIAVMIREEGGAASAALPAEPVGAAD